MPIRAPVPALACGALLLLLACHGDAPTEVQLAKGGTAAPLRSAPSALSFFSAAVPPATITVSVQFVGVITAVSSDEACATVSPGSAPAGKPRGSSVYVATFAVTPVGPGSCVITVADKQQRTAQTTVVVRMRAVPGKLAYSHTDFVQNSPVSHIRFMSAIGADPVNLTPGVAAAVTPALSPDGSEIAFFLVDQASTRGLARIKTDGTGLTWVLQSDASPQSPSWTRDGLRLAYSTRLCCASDIATVNPDGSQNTLVTSGEAYGYPEWSPDGTRIAYTTFDDDANMWVVFLIDADGSNPTRFIENALSPEWSPDGTRIVYRSEPVGGDSEIYVMNADGSGQTRLTNSPGFDGFPTWSPDGTMIAFDSERTGDREIYLMEADGTGVINLTNTPGFDGWATWR